MKKLVSLFLLALVLTPLAAAKDRRPAPVMGYQGASWLERPGRDQEQRPGEVIRAMGLRDGDVVADLGAGTGYFTRRLAKAVAPSGRVYAVDVQPEMIAYLKLEVEKAGLTNVVPVLGNGDDPRLPPDTVDWILLVDVYHEAQQPKAMLARMREALAPGGEGRSRRVSARGVDRPAHSRGAPHVPEAGDGGVGAGRVPPGGTARLRPAFLRVREDPGSLNGHLTFCLPGSPLFLAESGVRTQPGRRCA